MKHLLRTLLAVSLLALPFFAPVAQSQTARTILIEEFSGDWCGHCPKGADTLATIMSYRNDVRIMSYHGGGSDPLQTVEGNGVIQKIGLGGYPQASIDRVVWNVGGNPQRCLSRSLWRPATDVRGSGVAAHLSPCNVSVSGTYDPNTREINVTVTVNVVQDMDGAYNINVVLVENNINLRQVFYSPSGTVYLDPYYQMHVVRKMITGVDGAPKTTTGWSNGEQVTHNVTYTIPQSWNLLELHLTAFVSKMEGQYYREIQQSFQDDMLSVLTTTPVEMKSLFAQSSDDGIYLTWTTASESNNKGWFVERSEDGIDWENIAFVNGNGTTTEDHFYSYTDETPEFGNVYTYRLKQVDYDGSYEYSQKISVAYNAAPTTTQLHQNFPNPFNPSTEIAVDLANDSRITLDVYDAMGRLVNTLAEGSYNTGTAYFSWDGTDMNGARVPAGMYYYRLTTPTNVITKQMILAK